MIDQNDVTGVSPRRSRKRLACHPYIVAAAVSAGVHLVVLEALTVGRAPEPPPVPIEPAAVVVSLHRLIPPPPPPPEPEQAPQPSADAAAAPKEASAPAVTKPARAATRPRPPRTPPPPTVATLPVPAVAAPAPFPTLGEAQLAGALTAGSGAGGPAGSGGSGAGGAGSGSGAGGPCDMVQRIQNALRSDPEVRSAIAQAHRTEGSGRALLLWNGDWIQNPGQSGKGLAGVRQAIGLEVAFAPAACRTQSVRGFAVITLADGPGAPRVALGTAAWRWSDLTGARR